MEQRVGRRGPATVRRGSPSDVIVWSASSPWWSRYAVGNADYLSWEADAHRVYEWAVLRIPDMLHTPEYTQALLRADLVFRANHLVGGHLDYAGARRISDEVESREQRLQRLSGRPGRTLEYTAVVEEAALRRVVGNHAIMRAQLEYLVDLAGWQAVTLRLVPEQACAFPDTDGGFALLEFPDPTQHTPMMFAHYPGGVVCEADPRVIERARHRWDAVLNAALPEADSTEVIDQLAKQLYPA